METPPNMTIFPDPHVGDDLDQPGFWAELSPSNPWPWGQGARSCQNPESRIARLRARPLLREPGLRYHCTGLNFFQRVNLKPCNIEAMMIQSTGDKNVGAASCDNCRRGCGPFRSCVQVPGVSTACANCHWGWQAKRCQFSPPDTFERAKDKLRKAVIERESAKAVYENAQRSVDDLSALVAQLDPDKSEQ